MKKDFQQYMNHRGVTIRDLEGENLDELGSMISTAEVAYGMGLLERP